MPLATQYEASGCSLPAPCLIIGKQLVERPQPLGAVGPVRKSFGAQEVAQLRVGADDAERHLA